MLDNKLGQREIIRNPDAMDVLSRRNLTGYRRILPIERYYMIGLGGHIIFALKIRFRLDTSRDRTSACTLRIPTVLASICKTLACFVALPLTESFRVM